MIDKTYIKKLLSEAAAVDNGRRTLSALASEALSDSKRAIFAMHRTDAPAAARQLQKAEHALKRGNTLVKKLPRLAQEGFWRAAQEEFAEAVLFQQYVEHGKIKHVEQITDPDIYLGALSDFTGELVRLATLIAAEGEQDGVLYIYADVEEAVSVLLQIDATGSLRTKIDQARKNLKKLEEMRYELSLRR